MKHLPPIVRFIRKVHFSKSGCWIWKGAKNDKGYGSFCWNKRRLAASRFSYLFFKEEIPVGKSVLHNCKPNLDNKACVNPAHLWLGTHLDNLKDAIRKGQWSVKKHCLPNLSPWWGHNRLARKTR